IYTGEITQAQVDAELAVVKTCVIIPPPPPVPAVLKHYYEFDDAWEISGLLTDSEGSVFGSRIGSPSKILAPPNGIKPETCSAAQVNRGAFHLNGLGVDTSVGEANSVTFWMYWDGSNSVMPFGWYIHDLWFYGGSFGFNSGNGDIYGIASAGLANGWHHVAAVFNNGRLRGNSLYIDGVLQTLTQQRSSPNNARAFAASSATISGWRLSSGYRFSGSLDEVKIYTGKVTQDQVNDDMAAKSCAPVSPYAYFTLDDFDLNGTPGEIVDNMGNANSARAEGTAAGVAPNPEGKVCYGVDVPADSEVFPSVAIDTGVDIDSDIGNTGTINFWYRSNEAWNSGNARMLFDASKNNASGNDPYFYLLLKNDGKLRFGLEDINDGDVRRDTAAALDFAADQWVHLSVVYSLPLATYKIYVNGVEQALTTVSNSISSSTIGQLDTLYFGDNRSTYFPGATPNSANGRFDEVRIYRSVLTVGQINADMNATHNCKIPPVKEDPAFAFNCVYSGLDPVAGRLYTRVAGSAFNFDVIALEDSNGDLLADGVETNFAKDSDRNITVELVDTSASGNCTTYPVLSPAVSQVMTFTAADAGIKASANMTVNKAYRSVACRVTDATDNPAVVACSSDSFSIRPASLTLDAPVLNNAGFENDPTAKAGESFVLSVTATPGYNGTPAIKAVDPITAHAGGSAGLLSGSFSAANLVTGTATGNTFSYSEVGNF
ncbi:MAG: LamG domain-containing protein, partial [Gammaproteobacteria bacterium]|nr:LamG domain-containing protein [Gammaproteobacteria bacterium]